MDKTDILIPALRQYKHNDGSGLLMAYDKTSTDQIVSALQYLLEQTADREHSLADALEALIGEHDNQFNPALGSSRCTIDDALVQARAALTKARR